MILVVGCLFGATAVILGAFGAHVLSESLTPKSIQTFETGVKYQMYHALLLIFIGSVDFLKAKTKKVLFYLLVIGVIFFSGSIYLLATNALTTFDFTSIALLTPLGGLLLITAWLVMVIDILRTTFS